jgi:hypothetical protein
MNVSNGSNAFIVTKGGVGSDSVGKNMNYGIWMIDSENIQTGFENSSGANHFVMSPSNYSDGNWHYAVGTYDGSAVKLYVDGVQVASNLTTTTPPPIPGTIPDNTGIQPVRIGANSLGLVDGKGDGYFIGGIGEIRVWNRSLSAEEVSAAYNNGLFNTTGQVLYLPFSSQNHRPVADAGPDLTVNEKQVILLNNSKGSDPDPEDTLIYKWTQIGGSPFVSLSNNNIATPVFNAPLDIPADTTFTLQFSVTDNHGLIDTDTMNVLVKNIPPPPSPIPPPPPPLAPPELEDEAAEEEDEAAAEAEDEAAEEEDEEEAAVVTVAAAEEEDEEEDAAEDENETVPITEDEAAVVTVAAAEDEAGAESQVTGLTGEEDKPAIENEPISESRIKPMLESEEAVLQEVEVKEKEMIEELDDGSRDSDTTDNDIIRFTSNNDNNKESDLVYDDTNVKKFTDEMKQNVQNLRDLLKYHDTFSASKTTARIQETPVEDKNDEQQPSSQKIDEKNKEEELEKNSKCQSDRACFNEEINKDIENAEIKLPFDIALPFLTNFFTYLLR